MGIKLFTDEDLSGKSIGPSHGPAMERLNALIEQSNAAVDGMADATIAVADAAGGATGAALTLQLQDLEGNPLARVAVVKIVVSDTEYAGVNDANSNVTFGTATAGSILASGNGYAVVKTSATGAFACTASNSADETAYFSVVNSDGGVDALAAGVCVRSCVPDDATWAAA